MPVGQRPRFVSLRLSLGKVAAGEADVPAFHVSLTVLATWLSAWCSVPGGIFAPWLSIGAGVGRNVSMIAVGPARRTDRQAGLAGLDTPPGACLQRMHGPGCHEFLIISWPVQCLKMHAEQSFACAWMQRHKMPSGA